MTIKKNTPTQRSIDSAPRQPSAYHRLDALLHTMRRIAQYEDALCELSHEVKRKGEVSPEMSEELDAILTRIPSHDFMLDLEAVKAVLIAKRSSTNSKGESSKPKKSSFPQKAAKKTGRKPSK